MIQHYSNDLLLVLTAKMRLFDVEQSGQNGITDSGHSGGPDKPLNTFGNREKPQKKFDGFKV